MEQICTESGGVAKVNLHICKFAYYANVDHERITNLHSMQTCLIVGYCLVFFTLIMPGFTKVAFATSVDPDPMASNVLSGQNPHCSLLISFFPKNIGKFSICRKILFWV